MEFEINQAGMDQLQRELEQQFSAGIQVPRDGTEEDAIQSVKNQLIGMGATPDDAAVLQVVRDVRGQ